MKITIIASLAVVALATLNLPAQAHAGGLVVHEWGTFTSFQGSDGNLLEWKPLETSQLPKFVYDWNHPGLGRQPSNPTAYRGKGRTLSLQRMETPVIYFYSEKEQNVDVSVRFPDGLLTEWYPQAAQVGPSIMAPYAGKLSGIESSQTAATGESMISWPDVGVLPAKSNGETTSLLPMDASGSHYFAARETDAATLESGGLPLTRQGSEHEKFLFYRGVAHFAAPLRVVMKSDDAVEISNTGNESLAHLFVLAVRGGTGSYVYVPELAPGEVKTVLLNPHDQVLSSEKLKQSLVGEMSSALAHTGLYPREALAMVNTWKDSWFQEQGVRVLYALPRAWTDRTLPMTLNPAPQELIRTMVGRAEVLPPDVERSLAGQLEKLRQGNPQASIEARRILKDLGRFAEPALDHAAAGVKAWPDEGNALAALLKQPE